jgi:hypothetical protein
VYYSILDSIVMCINNKFKENDLSLLNSMSDVLFNKNSLTESIYEVCKTYKLESEDLSSEIKILNRLFMNQGCNSIIKRINYVKTKDIQTGFPIFNFTYQYCFL